MDIKLGKYDIEFKDLSNNKVYEIEGGKTEITDLVLNKSVKVLANGKSEFVGILLPNLFLHYYSQMPVNLFETEIKGRDKSPLKPFSIHLAV